MHANSILILKKFRRLIHDTNVLTLTDDELIHQYQIEYAILETLHKPTVSDTACPCSGCHGESGIALRVEDANGIKHSFIYTNSNEEVNLDSYNLTIFRYDPKARFTCEEIYHRKSGQEPNTGWIKHASSNVTVADALLARAG